MCSGTDHHDKLCNAPYRLDQPPVQILWKKGESVQHLVSGCEKLAQKEYKRQHDNVAKKVHWESFVRTMG